MNQMLLFEPKAEPKKGTLNWYVLTIMRSGAWHTLWGLQDTICQMGGPYASDASISARIRDLRNKYGHTIARRARQNGGGFEYQLEV